MAEWTAIDTHLEKLMKEPEFRKEGVPKVYWQQLLAVDSIIRKQKDDEKKAKADANDDDDSKDSKKGGKPAAPKKMNAEQARAQTRLHAHVKKLMKTYEKQLTEYKKAPLPDTAEEEPKGKGKLAAADEDGDEGDEDEGEAEDDKDAEDEDGDEEEGEGEDDDDDGDGTLAHPLTSPFSPPTFHSPHPCVCSQRRQKGQERGERRRRLGSVHTMPLFFFVVVVFFPCPSPIAGCRK